MLASDIMTTNVITVGPDSQIDAVSTLLLEHHITAVPVVDEKGNVLGIISDSDLMLRMAGWPAPHESLLRVLTESSAALAKKAKKVYGETARDLMTSPAISIGPERPLDEIAELFANEHLRRVPVVSGGKLVGIVSRSNLVHALASTGRSRSGPTEDDRRIREQVEAKLRGQLKRRSHLVNSIVTEGTVHLWGVVETEEESEASRVVAESITGVEGVKNHLATIEAVPSDIASVV